MDVSLWEEESQSSPEEVTPYQAFKAFFSFKDGQQFRDFSAKLSGMIPSFHPYGSLPDDGLISYGERAAAKFQKAVANITWDVLVTGLKEPGDAANELAHAEVAHEYDFADTAAYHHVKSFVLKARYMDALSGCQPSKLESISSDMKALSLMDPASRPPDLGLYNGIAGSLMSDRMDMTSLYGGSAGLESYTILNTHHLSTAAGKN